MVSDPVPVGERAEEIAAQVERPEELAGENVRRRALLFRERELAEYPHRDPEKLRDAWDGSETVAEAADELGSSASAVSKWLAVFGLRARARQNWAAHKMLKECSPTELGFEELPEGEA